MHGDTLIWGPWCGPVQFYLGSHQPGTQGIEDGDTPGPQFSLSPIPASSTVTVATEGLQGTVAIMDLQGYLWGERRLSMWRRWPQVPMWCECRPRKVFRQRNLQSDRIYIFEACYRLLPIVMIGKLVVD